MSQQYQGYPYVNPPVTDAILTDRNTTANTARPYQGYPYVNLPINDAPSIDATTANRWMHLPKKQMYQNTVNNSEQHDNNQPSIYSRKQEESDENPVVYVDVPLQNDSVVSVTQRKTDSEKDLNEIEPDDNPVIYIDIPETSDSDVTSRVPQHHDVQDTTETKVDFEDAPVVYIDCPELSGCDVTHSRGDTQQSSEPPFVQDTIFYDPFDNRRIDEAKEGATDSDDDVSESSPPTPRPFNPVRRPNTLNLNMAGPSGSTPASMMKETQIYRSELPIPIPVSQFPEPPPAYTEIDNVSSPTISQPDPERTVVILPGDNNDNSTCTSVNDATSPSSTNTAFGTSNQNRKVMTCQYCGQRVQTLVILENGIITHAFAVLSMLFCLLPAVACIYCTDYMKVTNHYCPRCNRVIAYVLPFMRNRIVYTD